MIFGVERLYADVVRELGRTAQYSLQYARRREAWQVRWFGRRSEESTAGPLQEWKSAWVASSVVEWEAGSDRVAVRLPGRLGWVRGAEAAV